MATETYKIIMPGTQIQDGAEFKRLNQTVTLEKKQGDRLVLRGILIAVAGEEKPSIPAPTEPPAFGISEMDVSEAIPKIQATGDITKLEALLAEESAGKNRKTVKNAIAERLEELKQ